MGNLALVLNRINRLNYLEKLYRESLDFRIKNPLPYHLEMGD
jgi:hypothetical protein